MKVVQLASTKSNKDCSNRFSTKVSSAKKSRKYTHQGVIVRSIDRYNICARTIMLRDTYMIYSRDLAEHGLKHSDNAVLENGDAILTYFLVSTGYSINELQL